MACSQKEIAIQSDIGSVHIRSNEEEISCNRIAQRRFSSEIGNIEVFSEGGIRRNCTVEIGQSCLFKVIRLNVCKNNISNRPKIP